MNSSNVTLSYQSDRGKCLVCGRSVHFGGGNVKVSHRGTMVNLCGLYCMAAFVKDPDVFIGRRDETLREKALEEAQKCAREPRGVDCGQAEFNATAASFSGSFRKAAARAFAFGLRCVAGLSLAR